MKYGPANSLVSCTTGQDEMHDKHSIQLRIFLVSAYSSGFIIAGHSGMVQSPDKYRPNSPTFASNFDLSTTKSLITSKSSGSIRVASTISALQARTTLPFIFRAQDPH